jgi:hypothetical protein
MFDTSHETPDLGKLLEKTQNLLANQGMTVTPRSLEHLSLISRKLAQQHDVNFDGTAQMFLAKRGVDVTKHQQILQSIDLKSAESVDRTVDWDIERSIEAQQTALINSVVDECNRFNSLAFDDTFTSYLAVDWNQTKREIVESMNFSVSIFSSFYAHIS